MSELLDTAYWSQRYQRAQTGWDIGAVSRPLQAYFDQLTDKNQRILIPGAGNAYEAEYLWKAGFSEVFVLDVAPEPLAHLRERCPSFPSEHLLHADFFDFQPEAGFDLIVEQTFFCALLPERRPEYVRRMHHLLKRTGKLAGVLFQIPLNDDRPPFGGTPEEYRCYFETHFVLDTLETCYNSIPPRAGSELFLKALPKDKD